MYWVVDAEMRTEAVGSILKGYRTAGTYRRRVGQFGRSMRGTGRHPELLIPASSLEVLKTAVIFGADAVYIGGEEFGLRAKAKNFSMEEMAEGIAFAHAHGVKVHVTVNILAHNYDLEGVKAYLRELRELSYRGANVLHEDAIFPVRTAGIPINIRNTNQPQDKGTMIVAHADRKTDVDVITGIAGRRGFSVLTIEKDMMNSLVGFGRKVLQVFENHGISFEHLPSGIDSVGVIVASEALDPQRDAADHLWARNVEAARAYRAQHGDLEVPHGYVQDGVQLYSWLASLRQLYRSAPDQRGSLTPERIAQLDALGMRWGSKSDLAWEKGYAEAAAYYKEHGAADAPVTYVTADGYRLGKWLSRCRVKYAKGTLPLEKIQQLERIHMVWDRSRENDWNECFEMVKDYYLTHGDLSIPRDYVAGGVWLNRWLREQKLILQGKREGKTLTEEQKRKLASISLTTAEKAAPSGQPGRIQRPVQRAGTLN